MGDGMTLGVASGLSDGLAAGTGDVRGCSRRRSRRSRCVLLGVTVTSALGDWARAAGTACTSAGTSR